MTKVEITRSFSLTLVASFLALCEPNQAFVSLHRKDEGEAWLSCHPPGNVHKAVCLLFRKKGITAPRRELPTFSWPILLAQCCSLQMLFASLYCTDVIPVLPFRQKAFRLVFSLEATDLFMETFVMHLDQSLSHILYSKQFRSFILTFLMMITRSAAPSLTS